MTDRDDPTETDQATDVPLESTRKAHESPFDAPGDTPPGVPQSAPANPDPHQGENPPPRQTY